MTYTNIDKQADAFLNQNGYSSDTGREKALAQKIRQDNEFNIYARKYGGQMLEIDEDFSDPDVDKMIRRAISDRKIADRMAMKAERLELIREASERIKSRGSIKIGNAIEAEQRIKDLLGAKY